MYRVNNGTLPRNIQRLFNLNIDSTYTTRQRNKFKVCYARTSVKASCPSVSGVRLWNNLDPSICQCNSLDLFKKLLRQQILLTY